MRKSAMRVNWLGLFASRALVSLASEFATTYAAWSRMQHIAAAQPPQSDLFMTACRRLRMSEDSSQSYIHRTVSSGLP